MDGERDNNEAMEMEDQEDNADAAGAAAASGGDGGGGGGSDGGGGEDYGDSLLTQAIRNYDFNQPIESYSDSFEDIDDDNDDVNDTDDDDDDDDDDDVGLFTDNPNGDNWPIVQSVQAEPTANPRRNSAPFTLRMFPMRQQFNLYPQLRITNMFVRAPATETTSSTATASTSSGSNPINMTQFDTDLPAEHLYLGDLDRVSGVDYLEPGKYHKILILKAHSLVFPGETVPMIIPSYLWQRSDDDMDTEKNLDGYLFGIIFPSVSANSRRVWGVTCQIYEKGVYEGDYLSIKSRACQRFKLTSRKNKLQFSGSTLFPEIFALSRRQFWAWVKILPETVLADSLFGQTTNSISKLRANNTINRKIRSFESACTPWPSFLYDIYDCTRIEAKILKHMATLNIQTKPMDPISRSFWYAKNILLNGKDRREVFLTNCATKRILLIGATLIKAKQSKFFICRRCSRQLADYNSLFAMSKQGVQSNYCNPTGTIHETNTVYTVHNNAVFTTGSPSSEFTWFPGYEWQAAMCNHCKCHLGWRFTATAANLMPKYFYGLTSKSVYVKTIGSDTGPGEITHYNVQFHEHAYDVDSESD